MHFCRFILLSFLAAASSVLPAFCSDWDEGSSARSAPKQNSLSNYSEKKFVLHGGVEHSERLPALDKALQAGASFNPRALQEAKFASSWFKIPSWFAGTFRSTESTVDYIKDYATGKVSKAKRSVASMGQELHGFQRDARGEIWQYYVRSGTSQSEQGAQLTYNSIDWYGPELVSKDKVIMRVLATSLVVDKRTGIIVDSFRREDIKTYEPSGHEEMKVSYTSKSFDSHGRPRDLQNGYSYYHLVAGFQPLDRQGKLDYRQMFKDFLVNEHLNELLPQ